MAKWLGVTRRTVDGWLSGIRKSIEQMKRETAYEMWMACHTQDEIAHAVDADRTYISKMLPTLCRMENFPKRTKLDALYENDDWQPELYDIWNFAKNEQHKHFGNTHAGIVDNLLYKFTQPFDIVVDPFAGGGATIDV